MKHIVRSLDQLNVQTMGDYFAERKHPYNNNEGPAEYLVTGGVLSRIGIAFITLESCV